MIYVIYKCLTVKKFVYPKKKKLFRWEDLNPGRELALTHNRVLYCLPLKI